MDLYLKPVSYQVISHPMNAGTGTKVVSVAEELIRKNNDQNGSWKEKFKDSIEPAVSCIKNFSDRFEVSMSAGALVFIYGTLYFWMF